jgi:hypothetical protein
MKVFVSQSAEITEAYLKRKIKIGAPVQIIVTSKISIDQNKPSIRKLWTTDASRIVNQPYVFTITDVTYTKEGAVKSCKLTYNKKTKLNPLETGLKNEETYTAAQLIKLLSNKLTKTSKVGSKCLKFVSANSEDFPSSNTKLKDRLVFVQTEIKKLQKEERNLKSQIKRSS